MASILSSPCILARLLLALLLRRTFFWGFGVADMVDLAGAAIAFPDDGGLDRGRMLGAEGIMTFVGGETF